MLNINRSIWAGVIAYAVNLTALSVLSNLVGPLFNGVSWADIAFKSIVGVVTFASTYFAADWYFKHATKNPTNGLLVGLVIALSSLVITVVQVVPGVIVQGGSFMFILDSLKNWPFWAIIGITLLSGAAAGMKLKK